MAYRASDIGHRLSEGPRLMMKLLVFVATFPLLPLDAILHLEPSTLLGNIVMMLVGPVFWGSLVFFLSRRRTTNRMKIAESP